MPDVRIWLIPAALFGLLMLLAASARACTPGSPLEQLYCQLQARGEALPAWADFRRNPPATQRLLLLRPAQRAGLAVPEAAARAQPAAADVVPARAGEAERQASAVPVAGASDADCRLQQQALLCGQTEYRLSANLPNSRLDKGALGEGNQLLLAEALDGDRATMIDNYQRYIEAMLSIGLGGATMSYTKFHHAWHSALASGENPSARFARMFEYLKRDKQQLAVQSRYGSALPQDISWCSPLGDELWVCDQKAHNWVYVRR